MRIMPGIMVEKVIGIYQNLIKSQKWEDVANARSIIIKHGAPAGNTFEFLKQTNPYNLYKIYKEIKKYE